MTTISRQRSLEQERAKYAWQCVSNVKQLGEAVAEKYASFAKNAPADIQANGLGQTLAFWRAKGKEGKKAEERAYTQLLQDVSNWVGTQNKFGSGQDILAWVIKTASTNDYRRATAEAIAFLIWLKRFAEAELDHEQTGA